jgi:hypothetical protein
MAGIMAHSVRAAEQHPATSDCSVDVGALRREHAEPDSAFHQSITAATFAAWLPGWDHVNLTV